MHGAPRGVDVIKLLTSVRARLALVIVLAVVPVAGLLVYEAGERRRSELLEAERDAARVVVTTHDAIVAQARQLLATIARIPAVRARDTGGCDRMLAEIRSANPRYANLGAVTPDGAVFCSALPLAAPLNLADRDYVARALATREFAAGGYQIGRITGRPGVNFGMPALDDRGAVAAVVFAALDLEWLNELSSRLSLPSGSTLTALDRHGVVLVRHPDARRWVGHAVAGTELFTAVQRSAADTAVELPGLDGVRRLYVVAPLGGPETAAYVAVGIPREIADAPAVQMLRRGLPIAGAAFVLALVVAGLGAEVTVLRPAAALVRAARRLAAGDRSTRTGLAHTASEIGQLAAAFDAMAASLMAQEHALRDAERARSALEVARRLQQALLPSGAPRLPGLDVAALCEPSERVGGDYFDYLHLGGGRVAFVVADVSGHGVASALVVAGLRATLHGSLRATGAPALVVDEANTHLMRDLSDAGMFVTLFLGVYHRGSHELVYVNAGHPPPFLLRADGAIERLTTGGPILGAFGDARWEQDSCTFDAGSTLAVFTDGLTEAGRVGAQLGEASVERVLRATHGTAAAVQAAIMNGLAAHLGDARPGDDVTVMVVRPTA